MARVTVQDFMASGMGILAAEGPDALTVASLCEALDVTKGSFYHHFKGMPDYVERLLDYYESVQTGLVEGFRGEPDLELQMQLSIEAAVALDHAAESAMRAWGRSEPGVAACMERIDQIRESYLESTFRQIGCTATDARFFAQLIVTTLIGTQSRSGEVHVGALATVFQRLRDMTVDAAAAARAQVGAA